MHNVIQVGTRSQSTKSEVYSKNGMCIQVYTLKQIIGRGTGLPKLPLKAQGRATSYLVIKH